MIRLNKKTGKLNVVIEKDFQGILISNDLKEKHWTSYGRIRPDKLSIPAIDTLIMALTEAINRVRTIKQMRIEKRKENDVTRN
jgi:hypothetical protein